MALDSENKSKALDSVFDKVMLGVLVLMALVALGVYVL